MSLIEKNRNFNASAHLATRVGRKTFREMLLLAKEVVYPAWKALLKKEPCGEIPIIVDLGAEKEKVNEKKDVLFFSLFESMLFSIPSKIAAKASRYLLRDMAIGDNLSMTHQVAALMLAVEKVRRSSDASPRLEELNVRLSELQKTLKEVRDNISGPNHGQTVMFLIFSSIFENMKGALLRFAAGSAAADFEFSFERLKMQIKELEQNGSALRNGGSEIYISRTIAAVDEMNSQLRKILDRNGKGNGS